MKDLFNRESLASLRDLGLALFIVGSFYFSVPSVNATLADVPWRYMPASTLQASVAFYDVNFIPLAEQYLVLVNAVGDIQANAYAAAGQGVSAAAVALSHTYPVAAVAEWYAHLSGNVDARLSPK